MPFDLPNIVPENNVRLPDALNIQHGPARLLSRFILEGDRVLRECGVTLRVRHDFDELLYVNKQYAKSSWYPLLGGFNPELVNLIPENSFWTAGENEAGEIVTTRITRIFDWRGTNLEEQARAFFYGEDCGQPCIVMAEAAKLLGGILAGGAAFWVRPDYRGKHLSHWIPRIGKALACARWPIDWLFCYIDHEHVRKGLAENYGQKHLSHSIFYPNASLGPTGDVEAVVAYTAPDEFYEDIAEVMASRSGDRLKAGMSSVPTFRVHPVTNTSFDDVRQGNMSLS